MKMILIGLKGIVIGIANVIPGVSGGTMAFIMGIYDRLTEAIGDFFTNKEKRKEYFLFLLVIGSGAALGVVLFARLMENVLLLYFKQPTYFLFAGLIAGSVPFIMKAQKDMKPTLPRIGMALVGFGIILALILFAPSADGSITNKKNTIQTDKTTLVEEARTKMSNKIANIATNIEIDKDTTTAKMVEPKFSVGYGLWLSTCGFLSAGSMIVPGFSGSALMLALGEYANVISFINNRTILPLGFFAFGAILGLLVFAKLISFFLKKFPSATYYFILGLIFASFYQLWLQVQADFTLAGLAGFWSILMFVVGFAGAFLLGKIKVKKA